jgi:hypothetical protein
MLDPSFKSLCIVFSFVRKEQGVAIVEEYDRKSLYLMLVKCHEYLHLLIKSNKFCVNYDIFYHDYNLDIFEKIVISTSEPLEKLVKSELSNFKKYQLDVKDIKCRLQWLQKHETMFPII